MDRTIVLLVIGITMVLFIFLFWPTVKKLALNSIIGVALILLLNLVFNMDIGLNIYVIAAVTLFGLPGVGTILLLHFGEVI